MGGQKEMQHQMSTIQIYYILNVIRKNKNNNNQVMSDLSYFRTAILGEGWLPALLRRNNIPTLDLV